MQILSIIVTAINAAPTNKCSAMRFQCQLNRNLSCMVDAVSTATDKYNVMSIMCNIFWRFTSRIESSLIVEIGQKLRLAEFLQVICGGEGMPLIFDGLLSTGDESL